MTAKSTEEFWRLPATEIAARVKAREISATEVTESALRRLEQANPAINAVVDPTPEEARAAAQAVDQALEQGVALGPLAGVPVTVKDIVDQKGRRNANGLRIQKDNIARADSPVAANFRRAGAVIIGRTNTPAFSLRWFTRNSLYGATRNPRNPRITPGGSSGGAASATAAGIGAIGHGTDIAGSIRYPAYACGVHGLRPTLGRIPAASGAGPDRTIGAQLMAVSGPIARTIGDVRLGFEALAAPHLDDPWHTPVPLKMEAPRTAAMDLEPQGMTTAPEVRAALQAAADALSNAGWRVETIRTPPLAEAVRLQLLLWIAEYHKTGTSLIEAEDDPDASFVFAQLAAHAETASLSSVLDALQRRLGMLREWQRIFASHSVLIMPVSGELPFRDHSDVESVEGFARIVTAQTTQIGLPFMGLPGLAVTTGIVDGPDGPTPVGAQLVGGRFQEEILLRAGEIVEAATAPPGVAEPTA